MRRLWIFVLGVLGLTTTSCSGFTVERSNLGSFGSRNWSVPVFHLNRRNSVEKIFSNDFQSSDIENILRDPEMRKFVKLPAKKCSSSSEDSSQRLKRSEDVLDSKNHSPSVKKSVSELRETGIGSLDSGMKNSGPLGVTSPEELRSSGSSIVTSSKETRIPESTIVTSSKQTNTSESSIVSSPKESKTPTWTSGFVSTSKEIESSKLPMETIHNEAKTPDTTSEKNVYTQTLKNVVFLLIDDYTPERENYLKFFETARKFPVHGFLQNCPDVALPVNFPLRDSIVPQKVEENCDCEHILRTHIASLLSWGRRKEMTTGTVSSANFSTPLPFAYESPANQVAKEFGDREEVNGFHEEIAPSKSESSDVWRLIDIEKQTTSDKGLSPSDSPVPGIASLSKPESVNGFDGMWNVLDMLSRIRIAFFRILLESLGNMTGTEEGINGKKTLALQPSVVEMMVDAIREFKAVQNHNGFILVAAAPGNIWSEAIDVLQREILTKETLLVVSGICSTNTARAPFFAHGPGEKILKDARVIWDLPKLVERAMADGCLEKNCQKLRSKKPLVLPSIELDSLPQEPPRKRFGRATHKAEMNETMFSNVTLTKKPVEDLKKDKEVTAEIGKRSGSGGSDVRMDNVAKVLGIVTSVLTMLALNPS